MELQYTTADLGHIGSGFFSTVNHAHWIGENTTCVALKIYYEKYFNQELDVLKYLNEIDDHERNYIIKMFGHGEKHGNYFIALELGGKDLKKYYYERDPQEGKRKAKSNEEVLIKIVKGAAQALAQFHKYGVHRDIKHQNFVVSRDQDSNAEVVDVKLIDFNSSYLYEQNERDFVENSKRNDITNFGAMVYRLFNEHYIITGGLLATYDGNTLEFNRPVFDFILPLMKFRKISNYNAKK
uniref:Protein kinase domain-containing protein n=1 Tax=Meloidogyne enterolobii TaxID=390850 RepID=A0A6V7TZP8_MELEN|nr:unnamed protein product [Meloidogyne enterolobii]